MDTKDAKILLVDDEPDLLEVVVESLSQSFANVMVAESGFKALELLDQHVFDIIVTDVSMPKMSGLQLAAYIKAHEKNKHARLFILSGFVDEGVIEKSRSLNIVQVLEKPFDRDRIIDALVKSLEPESLKPVAYNPDMVELINKSVFKMLQYYVGNTDYEHNFIRRDDEGFGTCSSIIPIFGSRLFGSISLSVNREFLNLVARSIFGSDLKDIDEENFGDTVGELLNQMVGALKTDLRAAKIAICVGLPELFLGEGHKLIHKVASPVYSIPVNYGPARCVVEYCLSSCAPADLEIDSSNMKIFLTS